MGEYALSRRAKRDLDGIADYTIQQFGVEQSRRYRDSLIRTFELLAENPFMGAECGHIRKSMRRHAHVSHSIYYLPSQSGVLIVRILGSGQDPARHL